MTAIQENRAVTSLHTESFVKMGSRRSESIHELSLIHQSLAIIFTIDEKCLYVSKFSLYFSLVEASIAEVLCQTSKPWHLLHYTEQLGIKYRDRSL